MCRLRFASDCVNTYWKKQDETRKEFLDRHTKQHRDAGRRTAEKRKAAENQKHGRTTHKKPKRDQDTLRPSDAEAYDVIVLDDNVALTEEPLAKHSWEDAKSVEQIYTDSDDQLIAKVAW